PLSRIDQLGAARRQLEGSLSAIAQVSGRIDAFTVQGDVDVTPVRIRGASLGSSHLRFGMTQKPGAQQPTGKTRCGGRPFPPFDTEAYFKDTSSQGEYTIDGDLLGGMLHVDKLAITREKGPLITGRAVVKKLDLGAVSRIVLAGDSRDDDDGPSQNELSG